jgi:photosystem II stability/assembly factor-like uncharacterized protein
MKMILTAVFLTGFVMSGYTQWYWQAPSPQGVDLRDVEILPSQAFIAAGAGGAFIKSIDSGKNWGQLYSGIEIYLYDVDFVDENTGFAVGSALEIPTDGEPVIMKTVDGGNTWDEIRRKALRPVFERLSIAFIDCNHGTVTNGNTTLTTTNGGETWIETIHSEFLNKVYFTKEGVGFVVGSGIISRSTDAGITWTQQFSGAKYMSLYSISFIDNYIGFAVGSWEGFGGPYPILLKTTDGGMNWNAENDSISISRLWSVSNVNDSTVIAAGDSGRVVRSSNRGLSWTQVTTPTHSDLYSLVFDEEGNGVAVGKAGVVLTSSDGGNSWVSQNNNILSDYLYSISCTDKFTCTAVGWDGIIVRTTDAGRNWILQESGTNEVLIDVFFLDAKVGYAAGNNGTILQTTNGGESWNHQTSGTKITFYSIRFLNALTGIAAGDSGTIAKTSDGGDSWSVQQIDTISWVSFRSIFFIDPENIWIAGKGRVYKSTDGGVNWINIIQTFYAHFHKVYFTNTSNGFLIGFDHEGLILRTTNGGENWRADVNIGNSWHPFLDISFADEKNGLLVGYSTNIYTSGVIHRTVDGGKNWNLEYSNPGPHFHGVSFPDIEGGIAVGMRRGGGAILGFQGKINPPVFADVELKTLPTESYLHQNYPNPFNPTTIISYTIPEQASVRIILYDALGREVKTLVNEEKTPGNYSISLDATALATGIYYYQIKAGEFSETKKMVLIK